MDLYFSSIPAKTWIFVVLTDILMIFTTCKSIIYVRKIQPKQVYIVWYIFFLSLCVSIVLIYLFNQDYDELSKSHSIISETGRHLLQLLLDLKSDIEFLIVAFFICVVPQILSYMVSGIFGCGTPPVFVSAISRFVALSYIKSAATVAGVVTAKLVMDDIVMNKNPVHFAYESLSIFAGTANAFLSLCMYYKIQKDFEGFGKSIKDSVLKSFIIFMSRFSRAQSKNQNSEAPLDKAA